MVSVMPLMRVPYTEPLPPPNLRPRIAHGIAGTVECLVNFLVPATEHTQRPLIQRKLKLHDGKTLILSGAGISVASGLADYRGNNGTYRLNKAYRPIYYHEFIANHEARKRYWARSFLGWTNLHRARPNAAHLAIQSLGEIGSVSGVVTQNVDSFHSLAHPSLPTLELHGYLRACVCLTCRKEYPRDDFQRQLSSLNPAWADFLERMLEVGALTTEHPDERRKKGLRTNPDGDIELPDAPFSTFRYPACPTCLEAYGATTTTTTTTTSDVSLASPDASRERVAIDDDGAWLPTSTAGILKPAVVMFGESIATNVKHAAEGYVNAADRLLVIGSSLATYSAWRLVKLARDRELPIAILNIGGVRGEEDFLRDIPPDSMGEDGFRCSEKAEDVLPLVVEALRSRFARETFSSLSGHGIAGQVSEKAA